MNEVETSYRVIAFKGGGFVLVDTSKPDDPLILRAVSSLDELTGAISRAVIEWHAETQRVAKAQALDAEADNPKIIKPRRFWPSLLARASSG